MDRKEVMELFNKQTRIGTLSTANQNGDVNVAIFGSPRMIDENTVVMGIGKNRSLQCLQENPNLLGEKIKDEQIGKSPFPHG